MIKLQQQQNQAMHTSPRQAPLTSYQPPSLPQTFYDHVSLIIKLFRKQLTLFIKLSQSFIEETELVEEIGKKKEEGVQAVKEYEIVVVDQPMHGILQRFIARIREILQLTNNIAPGFLQYVGNGVKKVETHVHKNVGTITVYQIFVDILSILPSYFQSKSFSPQKAKQKAKENKQNLPMYKRSTALDMILQSFKKSCSLLSTLDIDEGEYRALFFSAREDRHKETGFLQNEMRYRNRFIREEMQKYDAGYDSYREKIRKEKENLSKKQMSRMKRMMSLNEKGTSTNKKVEENEEVEHNNVSLNMKQLKQQKKSHSPDFSLMHLKHQKSNLLTTYNFNEGTNIKHTSTHANMYYSNKERPGNKFNKERGGKEKAREEEFQDFINEIKVKGEFRMTKVLFGRDGKLELSPYTEVKPVAGGGDNPTAAAIKNKIIFRKAQENIRKKLNRFTTEPPFHSTLTNPTHNNTNHKNPHPPAIAQSSPPPLQKKLHLSTQPTQSLKAAINKKMRKFTWKDKEIKFMGIKGTNSSSGKGVAGE